MARPLPVSVDADPRSKFHGTVRRLLKFGSSRRGVAERFREIGQSRICLGLFHRWVRGHSHPFLGILDSFRMWRRNTSADSPDDQGHEQSLENLSTCFDSTVLPTDIQIPFLSQRGSTRNESPNASNAGDSEQRLRQRGTTLKAIMPVGTLNPGQKVSPFFAFPPSGRARIFVEADGPVDIYVSSPQQAQAITSVQQAAQFAPNILIYSSQRLLDQFVTLAPAWRSVGWNLTIGHTGATPNPIAVYYAVYPV
jgi:hypothetical protein